ncbi:hypothetical protein RFI_33900, partial [Reticulomyxa filosa]
RLKIKEINKKEKKKKEKKEKNKNKKNENEKKKENEKEKESNSSNNNNNSKSGSQMRLKDLWLMSNKSMGSGKDQRDCGRTMETKLWWKWQKVYNRLRRPAIHIKTDRVRARMRNFELLQILVGCKVIICIEKKSYSQKEKKDNDIAQVKTIYAL